MRKASKRYLFIIGGVCFFIISSIIVMSYFVWIGQAQDAHELDWTVEMEVLRELDPDDPITSTWVIEAPTELRKSLDAALENSDDDDKLKRVGDKLVVEVVQDTQVKIYAVNLTPEERQALLSLNPVDASAKILVRQYSDDVEYQFSTIESVYPVK